jgi:hypothetical protein
MDWLFERLIELAAWVAFILGLVFLGDAAYASYLWVRSFFDEVPDAPQLLWHASRSAGLFVASTLAMGALACIDRYVFDVPAPTKAK